MRNNVLKVLLWGEEVGRLYWSDSLRAAVFNFHPDFAAKGVDIAPLTATIRGKYGKGEPVMGVPPRRGDIYKGLPPFLADSLPDRWGDKLFNAWATANKMNLKEITPVDRLAFIGKRAMGAFEFVPDVYPYDATLAVDLEKLYDMATRIYKEREVLSVYPEDNAVLSVLYEMGTSAGGQHSKAVIAIHDVSGEIRSGQMLHDGPYTYYLLKFAEGEDFAYANVEMAYFQMATAAGIRMMPSRLLDIAGRKHFITQRFDRKEGEKIHTQTLAAIKPEATSYEDLFDVCDALHIPSDEKKELFRLAAFNFLAGNTDDHTKNFSFLMEKNGKWHVSPAYDVMFTVDLHNEMYGSFHSLSLGGKDADVTVEDLLHFAVRRGIKDAKRLVGEVCSAISRFYEFAMQCGVNRYVADRIERFLATLLPDTYSASMKHHLGTPFPAYITDEGLSVTDFRIKENDRHDFELWAVVNGKAYKQLVDGESELGQFIYRMGSYHASVEDKKKLLHEHLLPKVK